MAVLAILDALVIWAIPIMITNSLWPLLVLMVGGAAFINWAYLSPRAQAMRWLAPGLWLTAVFAVFPILYTAYVSLTNWQTGNFLNKSQVIEQLEARPGNGRCRRHQPGAGRLRGSGRRADLPGVLRGRPGLLRRCLDRVDAEPSTERRSRTRASTCRRAHPSRSAT